MAKPYGFEFVEINRKNKGISVALKKEKTFISRCTKSALDYVDIFFFFFDFQFDDIGQRKTNHRTCRKMF